MIFYYGQQEWFGDQNELKVYYRTSSSGAWTQLAHYTNNVSSWTMELMNLPNPSSTYQVAFEGINNYGRANVIDDVTIEESPTCPDPFALGSMSVTSSSAVVYWNGGSATEWQVEYGPSGFAQGAGSTMTALNDTASIGMLTDNSSYDFYVQASCGSAWVGPMSFTTLCLASSMPYAESFDAWPPSCWDIDNGARVPVQYGGDYMEGSFWAWNNVSAEALSQAISISVDAQVRFRWSHLYNSTYPDQLLLLVRVSGTSTWDTLSNLQGTSFSSPGAGSTTPSPDADFVLEIINLDPSYTGQTVEFRFDMNSGYGPDVFVDDFSVMAVPSCADPQALGAMNITSNSADVYWNGNGVSNFIVEYGSVGFMQGTGTSMNSANDTATISGLTDNTSYDYFVQADCGNNGLSAWSGPFSFSTLCVSASMPYTESFDAWPPSCWDIDGGAAVPVHYGNDYMEGSFWSWDDITGEALSQAIQISSDAEVSYRWSHLYNGTSYPNDQVLLLVREVGTSTWDTISNLIGPSFDSPGAGNTTPSADADFITETISLDPSYTGSTVEFRFDLVSDYGPDVFIDDFSVAEPSNPCAVAIDSINTVNANKGLYRAFFDSIPGDAYMLEYKAVDETTWRSKTINNANQAYQDFNITPSFGANVQVRLAYEMGGVWNYGCESIIEVPCKSQALSIVVQRSARCTADSVLVRAGYAGGYGAPSFLWSNGATTKRTYADQGEKLVVVVTDAAGCSVTDSITAASLDNTAIPENFSLSKDNATTFTGSWTAPALPTGASLIGYRMAYRLRGTQSYTNLPSTTGLSTTVDFTGSGLPAGNYEFVVFTRYNDGTSAVNSNFTCIEAKGYTGVGNKNDASTDASSSSIHAIYPNPTNGVVYVATEEGAEVSLLDISGRVITKAVANSPEVSFDMSNLAQGVYMIRIENNSETITEQVVKN
jgi:hypothetical protein